MFSRSTSQAQALSDKYIHIDQDDCELAYLKDGFHIFKGEPFKTRFSMKAE
jgi:hypothetical protein